MGQTIPRSLARATVPVREELPSFEAADESLALIEDSERCNASAISRLRLIHSLPQVRPD